MVSFPVDYIATLAIGLRHNSRIKMKLTDTDVSLETLLLAHIADAERYLLYSKTVDAKYKRNQPKSFVALLTKQDSKEILTFTSSQDFEKKWREANGD